MGDSTMTPGLRLQWGPKDLEDLKDLVDDLQSAIENAPCLVARPGELTYECRHDNLCRVCEWRNETTRALRKEWGIMMERKR
jgi:hypothetical protein